jgi:hypothetical protein
MEREPFLHCEELVRQLIPEKMVRVVLDGNASPNQGALTRQSWNYAWSSVHYDRATNKVLHVVPQGI